MRDALGLTQTLAAKRGGILRTELARVELAHNQAGSYAMRVALSRAFGLSLEDVTLLLDSDTPIATLKRRSSSVAAGKAA